MTDKIQCPHCGRQLADTNGARMHITAKHPRKKNPFASKNRHIQDDGEESIASLMIQNEIDLACGLPGEDWLTDMTP